MMILKFHKFLMMISIILISANAFISAESDQDRYNKLVSEVRVQMYNEGFGKWFRNAIAENKDLFAKKNKFGEPYLFDMIFSVYYGGVNFFIESGIDISIKDAQNNNLIHYWLNYIFKNGDFPDPFNNDDGKDDFVELAPKYPALKKLLYEKNSYGLTPYETAFIQNRYFSIVLSMLPAFEGINQKIENKRGNSLCFHQTMEDLGLHENGVFDTALGNFFDACFNGDIDTVKLIKDSGLDIKNISFKGITPLFFASSAWEFPPSFITSKLTPIMGKKGKYTEVVDYILKNGSPPDQNDEVFNTPLHAACHFGNKDIIKLLLENGADVNTRSYMGKQTPLHFLFRDLQNKKKYDIDIISLLINNKANINVYAYDNETPLTLSLGYYMGSDPENEQATIFLIKNGADVNVSFPLLIGGSGVDQRPMPLICAAAKKGYLAAMREMVKDGVKLPKGFDYFKEFSPCDNWKSESDVKEAAEIFLSLGAEIDYMDTVKYREGTKYYTYEEKHSTLYESFLWKRSDSPLMCYLASLLIDRGMEIKSKDSFIIIDTYKQKPNFTKMLLKKGLNINESKDKEAALNQIIKFDEKNEYRSQVLCYKGTTALHYACLNLDSELVKFLLENGADINLKDAKGRTGIMLAKETFYNSGNYNNLSSKDKADANNFYVKQKAIFGERQKKFIEIWDPVFAGKKSVNQINLAEDKKNKYPEKNSLKIPVKVSEWVKVKVADKWIEAYTLKIDKDKYLVRYDYGNEEWITRDRLKNYFVVYSPSSNPDKLVIGAEVAAQWTDLNWYLAKITAINDDKFDVLYFDGKKGTVGFNEIVPVFYDSSIKSGDFVMAFREKDSCFYKATVLKLEKNTAVIRWHEEYTDDTIQINRIFKLN